jgi:hypothetical protein
MTLLVCVERGSCSRKSSGRREVMDHNVIRATAPMRANDADARGQDDAVASA